jgi:hypothetical protein
MRANIGRRSRTPASRAARSAGVSGSPVTDTIEPGGSPARTRSSTRATAARPCSAVNSRADQTGSRRVTQVVLVTAATSISSWTAEMPPPTTTTCRPAKSSGRR